MNNQEFKKKLIGRAFVFARKVIKNEINFAFILESTFG